MLSAKLTTAQNHEQDTAATLASVNAQIQDLQAQLDQLEVGQKEAVEAAAQAKSAFVDRAILAYMNGRESRELRPARLELTARVRPTDRSCCRRCSTPT